MEVNNVMVELLNAKRAYILHMNLTSIITCYVDLKEQSKEKILVRILEAADSGKVTRSLSDECSYGFDIVACKRPII